MGRLFWYQYFTSLFIFLPTFYCHTLNFVHKYMDFLLLKFSSQACYFSFNLYLVTWSLSLLYFLCVWKASWISHPQVWRMWCLILLHILFTLWTHPSCRGLVFWQSRTWVDLNIVGNTIYTSEAIKVLSYSFLSQPPFLLITQAMLDPPSPPLLARAKTQSHTVRGQRTCLQMFSHTHTRTSRDVVLCFSAQLSLFPCSL